MNSPGGIEVAAVAFPSDQRLHPQDAAVREIDDGLIVQHPALVLDGLAQCRGLTEPEHRVLVDRVENTTEPPGPIFFERYIATSA